MIDDPDRAAAVFQRLNDALTALVLSAEASLGTRCPHRVDPDVCTFPGSCDNRAAQAGSEGDPSPHCGGDAHLTWPRR